MSRRDNFFDEVAPELRGFVDRLIEKKLVRGDAAVALAAIREIASYSRLAERIYVAQLAAKVGQHHTHVARALRKFHDAGALVYAGGQGHAASWISLRLGPDGRQLPIMAVARESVTSAGQSERPTVVSQGDQRWSPTEKSSEEKEPRAVLEASCEQPERDLTIAELIEESLRRAS